MKLRNILILAFLLIAGNARAISVPTGVTATAIDSQYTSLLSWNEDTVPAQWFIYVNGVQTYTPFRNNTNLVGSTRTFVMQSLPRAAPFVVITMRAYLSPNLSGFSAGVTITVSPQIFINPPLTPILVTGTFSPSSTAAATNVTVVSSALPTGAATSVNQTVTASLLGFIQTALATEYGWLSSTAATLAGQNTGNQALASISTTSTSILGYSALSYGWQTGTASTVAEQVIGNAFLSSLDSKTVVVNTSDVSVTSSVLAPLASTSTYQALQYGALSKTAETVSTSAKQDVAYGALSKTAEDIRTMLNAFLATTSTAGPQFVKVLDNTGSNVYASTTNANSFTVSPYYVPADRVASGAISSTQSATAISLTNCAVEIDTSGGMQSVIIQTINSGTSTLTFQDSLDGVTWHQSLAGSNTSQASDNSLTGGTAGTRCVSASVGGFKKFRVYCSSFTSGTNLVYMVASAAAPANRGISIMGTSGNGIINSTSNMTDNLSQSSLVALQVQNFNMGFNGSTWDKVRNNLLNAVIPWSTSATVSVAGVYGVGPSSDLPISAHADASSNTALAQSIDQVQGSAISHVTGATTGKVPTTMFDSAGTAIVAVTPNGVPFTGAAKSIPVAAITAAWNGTNNSQISAWPSTTYTAGTNAALMGSLMGVTNTYSVAFTSIAVSPTATDILTISASATHTVAVYRIGLSGLATAAGSVPLYLMRRSTADSGGTSTSATAGTLVSTNRAVTATFLAYTANPTLGTLNSIFRTFILGLSTTGTFGDGYIELRPPPGSQPWILTLGSTEQLVVGAGASSTVPAGTLLCADLDLGEW